MFLMIRLSIFTIYSIKNWKIKLVDTVKSKASHQAALL